MSAKSQKKFEPKVKRNITLPLLKLSIGEPAYIQITSAMFVSKQIEDATGKNAMEPATLVNCINLESDEECQIIVPAVLQSILKEQFAEDSYVGKGFQLIKHPKQSGKRYHNFSVAELDL